MNDRDDEMRDDDLKRYLVEEAIEDFEEGRLSRRAALRMIAGIAGAAAAAQMLEARAQQPAQKSGYSPARSPNSVPANDISVIARAVPFQGADGQLRGYIARPAKDAHSQNPGHRHRRHHPRQPAAVKLQHAPAWRDPLG